MALLLQAISEPTLVKGAISGRPDPAIGMGNGPHQNDEEMGHRGVYF